MASLMAPPITSNT